MTNNREGQVIPSVTFKIHAHEQWQALSSDDIFKNKTVILFALPGAFTPTCSSSHLPRYNELVSVFKAQGVDTVACLSVNDTFVMNAWADDQAAENILFLPDGNGEFSDGMGMLVDKSTIGFGKRSWRYSMLVKNGTIEKMFIEEQQPGDPFNVSDADTMLNYINPTAELPKRITIFTKQGCPHCTRAKKSLKKHNLTFEEIELGSNGISYSSLAAVTGQGTTPQVFIDSAHIGSADDLEGWFQSL